MTLVNTATATIRQAGNTAPRLSLGDYIADLHATVESADSDTRDEAIETLQTAIAQLKKPLDKLMGKREKDETGFDLFWAAYPKREQPGRTATKGSKALSRKQWVRLSMKDRRAALRGAKKLAHAVANGGMLPRNAEGFLLNQMWEDWLDSDAPKVAAVNTTAGGYRAGWTA